MAVRTGALRSIRVETLVFSGLAAAVVLAIGFRMPPPPLALQIGVLGALVALLGLPHGALDPLIARRIGLWRTPAGFAAFNLAYLAVVALVVVVWLLAPVGSLVVFLVVSAVHFGADWNTGGPAWVRAATGLGLLTLPSYVHADEVGALYATLAGEGGAAVAAVQSALGPVAVVAMIVGAALAWRSRRSDSGEILLAAGLAVIAPPLVFFAVYFCALHSARHLREGFGAERASGRLPLLVAIVYTVIPVTAVGIFLLAVPNPAGLDERLLQFVFIGLAGLTVPHMIVVALDERSIARRAIRKPIE